MTASPALPTLPAGLPSIVQIGEIACTYAALSTGKPDRLPVLMLHGWGANAALMLSPAERLHTLGHPVYFIDLPGFGDTSAPSIPWSVFDYANFVIAFCDALALDRVHIVGHSFGGRLGLILGSDHAQRIGKLALVDAAGVPPRRNLLASARLTVYKIIRDGLYRVGARTPADRLRQRYNARYGSADFQAVSGVMRETFKQVIAADLRPYARRVTCPALLIWGSDDADTPLWMGQMLEKLIPDAGLIVFDGAGHYSYLERTAEFVRIVDHFFTH